MNLIYQTYQNRYLSETEIQHFSVYLTIYTMDLSMQIKR
jgi:hypothetical protein